MKEKLNKSEKLSFKNPFIFNLNSDRKNNKQINLNCLESDRFPKAQLNFYEELNYNYENKNSNSLINNNDLLFELINEEGEISSDNKINQIEKILSKNNTQINNLDEKGLSLLHLSVIKGNKEIVNLLLKYGANPNLLSVPQKQTPLHIAFLTQNINKKEIIKNLIDYGAKDNIYDSYNNKPSDYDCFINYSDKLCTPENKNKQKKEEIYYKIKNSNLIFKNSSDEKNVKNNIKEDINYNTISNSMPRKNIFNENLISYNNNSDNENDILKDSLDVNNEKNNNNFNIIDNDPLTNNNNVFKDKILQNILNNIKENFQESPAISNNNTLDELFKNLIVSKRNSIAKRKEKRFRRNPTPEYNNNKNYYSANKKDHFSKLNEIYNTYANSVCNSFISTQNQTNKKKTTQNNFQKQNQKLFDEIIELNHENNDNNENNEYNNIGNSKSENNKLKNWLINLELYQYYNNFIQNDIYNYDIFMKKVKIIQKPNELYDFINNILKTNKIGHVYRILCRIDIQSGLIDPKIIDFILINQDISENIIKTEKSKLSFSHEKQPYCCNDDAKHFDKNDLKCFLSRYDLMYLYQNFRHNGFELIEYLLLQMYSRFPINDELLENNFHIYNKEDRDKVLNALIKEIKKINIFLSSDEYLTNPYKDSFKYENIIFEEKENEIKVIFSNNNNSNDCGCSIF